jgi:uncharacterized protein YigE (DUF2233 family)
VFDPFLTQPMKIPAHLKTALLLISAVALSSAGEPVREERVAHAGTGFLVVRLEPKRVQLVWKDASGVPFRSFERVQADRAAKGETVKFLMNAGIFEPGGMPSGLHIEGGQMFRPLNLADAPGNFFLKPNGVLVYHRDSHVTLTTSVNWQKNPRDSAVWGIQAGPMLLVDGHRHPAFLKSSEHRLRRNGVGLDTQGHLVFAMTDREQVSNLWDFAGLFLDLGCKNALFLDGDISGMAVNPEGPVKSNLFGAIFVVSE